MKKILYIHGFGSSAKTLTVSKLQEQLPDFQVVAHDIPLHPSEAIPAIRKMVDDEQPDIILGTSMGGMYTEQLRGRHRILVNPAFQMAETMASHGLIGKQTWQNPRQDGETEFIVTKALVKEYKEATELCFKDITDDDRQLVYGLFGDNDPLVHTFDLFHQHYPNAIHFHGEHRITEPVIKHYLVPLIRQIDDLQERRERPVVMLHFDTLHDSYMNATASMHKAFEALIKHYNVYVLAPSPTNNTAYYQMVTEWVEKYLSAPAHGRIVFCNNPALLMADFLVADRPTTSFPGTVVEWGSPTFKTWEEIIIYFDRLLNGCL